MPTAETEMDVVNRLRAGDETAFAELVDRHGATMLRVARTFVRDRAVAEEVVQETWLAVLEGIDRFEGRSSLRTWLFTILANRARTRGEREARTVPFAVLAKPDSEGDQPAVGRSRFQGPEDEAPHAWASPPRAWPEERLLAGETIGVISRAIDELPEAQREVIRLRDVEGWSATEVVELLELTETNQRVLLHRARSKVRAALEEYLDPELEGVR